MKKAITIVLAAAMLTACSVTAFAESITQNSDPKTGDTTVSYTVDPAYTVVIPESVTLGDTAATEQIKIYGADESSNVVIPQGKKVNVALTNSTNGFNVKNADGDTIAYTVNDKSSADDLTAVAECAAGTKKNTDITFKKTGETKYAGTYTDTLTFTVSLTDAAVSHRLGADYLVNGCTATVRFPDYFSNVTNQDPASITFTNNNGAFELVSYGGCCVENAIVEQTADNKLKLIFQHIFNGSVTGQTTVTFDLNGMTYSVNDSGYYEIQNADSFIVDGTEIISELTKD